MTDDIAWLGTDGAEIACLEKRRLLADNLAELDGMLRDMFEDAILMGVDETTLRTVLSGRIDRLRSPIRS